MTKSEIEELRRENIRLRKLIKCCGPNSRCKTGKAYLQQEDPIKPNQGRIILELGSQVKYTGGIPLVSVANRTYSFLLDDIKLGVHRLSLADDKLGMFFCNVVSLHGSIDTKGNS